MDSANFFWGTATSAYQIEGGFNEDGKGESIWDRYASDSKNIKDGKDGTVACDSYHKMDEDIALLKELGVNAYRFSIAWTRIIPDGKGEVNQAGLDYYSRLVDRLLENNITPFVTLYHWDLPEPLQEEGGFYDTTLPDYFAAYVTAVVKKSGDRVKHWITINEPECIIGNGYVNGTHAPGYKETDTKKILLAIHNLLRMHGAGVKAIRANCPDAKVGFVGTDRALIPLNKNDARLEEECYKHFFQIKKDSPAWSGAIYYDPIYLGDYPKEYYEMFADDPPFITKKDLELIHQPLDFIGENNYASDYCTLDKPGFFAKEEERVFNIKDPKTMPCADIWWEQITPEGVYYLAKYLTKRYSLPLIFTENGMCDNTPPSYDRLIHDYRRSGYIKAYVDYVLKARQDGIDVRGYFYWSLLDNFEWGEGYKPRFGLVYIPFPDTTCIKKESFETYKNLIKEQMAKEKSEEK